MPRKAHPSRAHLGSNNGYVEVYTHTDDDGRFQFDLSSLLSSQILDHIRPWQTPVPFGTILRRAIYQRKYLAELLREAAQRCVFVSTPHVIHTQCNHFRLIDVSLIK